MRMCDGKGICVEAVNRMLAENPASLIQVAETNYADGVDRAAHCVGVPDARYRVVLLAGPSGSTKTTTAHRLVARLGELGVGAQVVSLDNFFKDRSDLPRLPDGGIDYESVHGLDLPLLQDCLHRVVQQGEADFPVFDFGKGGRSDEWQHLSVTAHTVLILEGIHALDPLAIPPQDGDGLLRLFVSPEQTYYYAGEPVFDGRTLRQVRRLIRDFFHRSNPLDSTLEMWVNVVRAEEHLMSLRHTADIRIDTALSYEPGLYAAFLRQCMAADPTLSEAHRAELEEILARLSVFSTVSVEQIPPESVLWEFLPPNGQN